MEIPIEVPEQYLDRYSELNEALGRAALRLQAAQLAYAEVIRERIKLNEEMRKYDSDSELRFDELG